MITVLNYCAADRDTALNLLRWIGQLGGAGKHELILQDCQQVVRAGLHTELLTEAKKHFANVEHFTPFTEDERGWPQSANHGWLQAVIHMRELFAKRAQGSVLPAWLWMEADCVPTSFTWADALEAAYPKANKPFMAAEVLHPVRRLSGIALYPARVSSYLRHRRLGDLTMRSGKGEAFDQYYSPEWIEFTHFTKLIQNVHFTAPNVPPTFPDAASLSLLDPEAVLFHRCKDGSLIERLRERMAAAPKPVVLFTGGGGSGHIAMDNPIAIPHEVSMEPTEMELLRKQVRDMQEQLSVKIKDAPRKLGGGRKKRERTLEQVAKDKERMARVRGARKATAV